MGFARGVYMPTRIALFPVSTTTNAALEGSMATAVGHLKLAAAPCAGGNGKSWGETGYVGGRWERLLLLRNYLQSRRRRIPGWSCPQRP